ncbi:DUF5605 domain-containing protein [Streptococcus ovuberis]|uniref:DUF5605 domain-containing protein n=1 Tax=Streptococcus ovuberis TaxID=1936207 RepID=A0A7X6MYT0_9STRE|nr:DUF5605 domain-containing protein [Streptococcus ovuberis]NKZ20361.1 DUF5605 domain-containing protein [Streptococcus ovuberis]
MQVMVNIRYLLLPEKGKYRLEIIDIWEMTRECVQEGVTGYIRLSLPSQEGIAVLATKLSEADWIGKNYF